MNRDAPLKILALLGLTLTSGCQGIEPSDSVASAVDGDEPHLERAAERPDGASPHLAGVCAGADAECTLREAAMASGVYMGSTSNGTGWTRGELATHVTTHFSSVTTENDLKWGAIAQARGD